MQGQNLHEHSTLDGQAEEMLWKHARTNVFCNKAIYTLYQILYSLLSGWVSWGNQTHWEINNANH